MPRSLPDEPLVCWDGLLSTAGTLSDNRSMQEPITRDPEVMHGTPVLRGTRVPVKTLFESLENGESLDDFLEGSLRSGANSPSRSLKKQEVRLARVP